MPDLPARPRRSAHEPSIGIDLGAAVLEKPSSARQARRLRRLTPNIGRQAAWLYFGGLGLVILFGVLLLLSA